MTTIISHNTWSYLPVRQWWLRPFAFIARCQEKSPNGQGVYNFDMRVRFNDEDFPVFAHGLVEYKGNVYQEIGSLQAYGGVKVTIRVLLETTPFMSAEERREQETLFYFFCHNIESAFPNIAFWGGWARDEWGKKIYTFKQPNLDIEEHHGSVSGNKLNCLRLRAWAAENNKAALVNCKKDYCMLDFVQYR